MTDTLTALDATFLELEQLNDGALMSIGGAMIFDPVPGGGVPGIEDLRVHMAARLGELPRYTQRLSSHRTDTLAWPQWVDDERFDIRDHVRRAALPPPGSAEQLCDFVAELFSHPLDRNRPLWEVVLVEGLEQGRWALAQKTHHCLVDGVGSVDVVQLLLDEQPEPAPPQTLPAQPPPASRAGRLPASVVQATTAGAHAAGGALHAARHPGEALTKSRALAELLVRDQLIGAPRTSLNVQIGQARRFVTVRVPLAELKAIGRELHGSVNDLVLTACSAGLRSLLRSRGEKLPARGLRAMVPMNLRDASGKLALGNRVTSLFVDLPVAEGDALRRLRAITRSTRRLKYTGAAEGPTTLMDLAGVAPPAVVHAALARTSLSTRLFNLTITNVPGPQRPLYAFGAQLRELYPVVPLAADHAVGIAIFSYNGTLVFGINADAESTRDIDVLADGIAEGLEELRELAPSTRQEMRS